MVDSNSFKNVSPQAPDQDLSVCTDQPRVRTRVLQHNRFSQLKEKCSEIITKNVRNKSKPTPAVLSRPNSFSHNTSKIDRNCKAGSFPDRRATYHCNRQPKTYELQDVNDIGEGFEIINIDDCLSRDDDHVRNHSPQVELLDLSEKNSRNRSVESLDSGCDIDTPRANQVDRQAGIFQKLSLDDSSATNVEDKNLNENAVLQTKVTSNEITRQESDGSTTAINIVCNIQVVSNTDNADISSNSGAPPKILQEQENPNSDLTAGTLHESQVSEQYDSKSSEEDEDMPLQFNEIFKLFEPNKNIDGEVSQYAEHLRNKLAWKLATEKVLKNADSDLRAEAPEKCSDVKRPTRMDCPVYDDPELDDFVSRCFRITCSVQENLSELQGDRESEESLLNCFIPKELLIPEISELDLNSMDSTSSDSMSWSDGEYLDIND